MPKPPVNRSTKTATKAMIKWSEQESEMIEGAETGRPLTWRNLTKMQKVINGYFEECEKKKEYITGAGLALSLGVTKLTLMRYRDDERFKSVLKPAWSRVQSEMEKHLLGAKNQLGAMFLAKNTFRGEYMDDRTITMRHTTIGEVLNAVEGEIVNEKEDVFD